MRTTYILLTIPILALIFSLQCTPPPTPQPVLPAFVHRDAIRFHDKSFLVVNVVDGDTFDIALTLTDPNRTRIRLLGVDTPETKHPRMPVQHYGPEATAYVIASTLHRRVTVLLDPLSDIRGKYGRLLAYIKLDDSTILNEQLLMRGLAYAETRFPHTLKQHYLLLQNTAQATSTGLWQNVTLDQLPPWLQRTNPNILTPPKPEPSL